MLRVFAATQNCSVLDALEICKVRPRLFNAAFIEKETPGGKRRSESSKDYAKRIKEAREAIKNGKRLPNRGIRNGR